MIKFNQHTWLKQKKRKEKKEKMILKKICLR